MKTTFDWESGEEVVDYDSMDDYEREEYDDQQDRDNYLEDEWYKSDDD